jgi:hypothetical protein
VVSPVKDKRRTSLLGRDIGLKEDALMFQCKKHGFQKNFRYVFKHTGKWIKTN